MADFKTLETAEILLSEAYEDEELGVDRLGTQNKSFVRRSGPILAIFCLISLLVVDLSLFRENIALRKSQYSGRSRFSELSYDTPVAFDGHSEWLGPNQTHAGELWDNLDVSPLVIAVTDKWAVQRNLDVSESRFPWDDEKGLYYLKAFHHLHCLKVMRKAWSDNENSIPPTIASGHIYHCLDALRQDIMCRADDTPMPTILKPDQVGNGQVMMCRNFDKLVQWTQEPEHQSCYNRLTDYLPLSHKLERFAFCPKDSKYFPVMDKYFKKWGHNNPYYPE